MGLRDLLEKLKLLRELASSPEIPAFFDKLAEYSASAADFFRKLQGGRIPFGADGDTEAELEQFIAELESPRPVGADPAAIDPGTILLLIQIARMLLEEWRKRRG